MLRYLLFPLEVLENPELQFHRLGLEHQYYPEHLVLRQILFHLAFQYLPEFLVHQLDHLPHSHQQVPEDPEGHLLHLLR